MLGSRHVFVFLASGTLFAGACSSSGSEAVPTQDAAVSQDTGSAADALADAAAAADGPGAGDAGAADSTTQNPSTVTPGPTPTTVSVRIPVWAVGKGPAAYVPNPIRVAPGSTVTWTNDDPVPHTATSDTGVWDSGTLTSGESFSFKFNTAGTFPYHCTIHGQQSMSGTVTVE